MEITKPFLFFSMQLDASPQLNMGRLFLIDEKLGFIGRWIATSGLGDYQDVGEWSKQGGGCIPPNYRLKGVPFYKVHTKPIYQSLGGINSNTYYIDPITVQTDDGIDRGELLIHKSRFALPMSGSLGCVVLPDSEFSDFEKTFFKCSKFETVPLLVGYVFQP
jgi:hypothetical protein